MISKVTDFEGNPMNTKMSQHIKLSANTLGFRILYMFEKIETKLYQGWRNKQEKRYNSAGT